MFATTDTYPLTVLLAQLAGQASSHNLKTIGLNFPNRWNFPPQYIASKGTPGVLTGQGFLTNGNVDPTDPTSEVVYALALGIDWVTFYQQYQYSGAPQETIPNNITGQQYPNDDYLMEGLFLDAYGQLRDSIWSTIKQFMPSGSTLYICGMGLGAPLAQLAAMDLKPGHQGPNSILAPATQPSCYVFSAPNAANSDFATFYGQQVVKNSQAATQTYWAKKAGLTVDFFPSAPTGDSYAVLGRPMTIDQVTLPAVDVPWWERGDLYYLTALGGAPAVGPNIGSRLVNVPDNFSLPVAYTLAELVANAYHETQQPGTSGTPPPSGYQLKTTLSTTSYRQIVSIYESNAAVVAVFRGTISWQEAQQLTANSSPINSVIVGNAAQVHQGVSNLYKQGTVSPGGHIFRTALQAALKPYAGSGKTLYLTGHDVGGAIANLAAIDYALNPGMGVQVDYIYTFGSMGLGDDTFQEIFNEKIGGKCYQIRRIYDQITLAFMGLMGNFAVLGTPIALNGQLTNEENTYHSLTGYLSLLNPHS